MACTTLYFFIAFTAALTARLVRDRTRGMRRRQIIRAVPIDNAHRLR